MPISIVVPQLGESVVEGTVAKWLKAEGDRVRKEEPLVEIQTDGVGDQVDVPADDMPLPEGLHVGDGLAIQREVDAVPPQLERVAAQPVQGRRTQQVPFTAVTTVEKQRVAPRGKITAVDGHLTASPGPIPPPHTDPLRHDPVGFRPGPAGIPGNDSMVGRPVA